MANRHAKTAQELEALLLEGLLAAEPVTEEITAEAVRPCDSHPSLITLPAKMESAG